MTLNEKKKKKSRVGGDKVFLFFFAVFSSIVADSRAWDEK